MATVLNSALDLLRSQHPEISLYTPDAPEYESLRKTFIISPARPSAIARPKSAEDVQKLIKVCIKNDIDFIIRTGGHNCVGGAVVDKALLIDMRDIAYVQVSEDKCTAKVGGGILMGSLLKVLEQHGLITPSGSIASVGYVGWSTLGGYGPFSSLYGLGVDQIVSAKLVTAKGDIVTVSNDLLKGIRGGGGIFGAIVELTIKVYPFDKMLVGTLIFDPSDMEAGWTNLTEGVQALDLPPALKVQFFSMEFPQLGNVFAAIITWVDDDHDKGRKWIEEIASLGKCIVNMAEEKTLTKYTEDNENLVHYGVHGRSYTLSLKRYTPKSVEVLAKYSKTVPGSKAMISIHTLSSPKPNEESVFGARETHHMVEIVAMTKDESEKERALQWGQGLLQELQQADPRNVLGSSYISLLDHGDADLKKIYGNHLDTLVALKRKYDPDNVFKHSLPRVTA